MLNGQDLEGYSAFAPDMPAVPSFNPPVPPEAWQLLVRSVIWREDIVVRQSLLESLRRSGSDVHDLLRNGVDVLSNPIAQRDALIAEATAVLDNEQNRLERDRAGELNDVFFVNDPFVQVPTARSFLECDAVNDTVRSYLGPDAIYQNVFLSRIPAGLQMNDRSGIWHHDKVGHRLKVFLLFQDVGEGGRPTWYAEGTHLMDWPGYHYQASRFQAEFVTSQFLCKAMHARRGDCVIFDTNGLHRASYGPGLAARSAMVLEFSTRSKFMALQRIGNFPIGVKPHHLPKGLDLDRTLVDQDLVQEGTDGLFYGMPWPKGCYPDFN